MFFSYGSWLASIMTDLKNHPLMQSMHVFSITVIEMHGENGFREDLHRRDAFQHHLVGVSPGTLAG